MAALAPPRSGRKGKKKGAKGGEPPEKKAKQKDEKEAKEKKVTMPTLSFSELKTTFLLTSNILQSMRHVLNLYQLITKNNLAFYVAIEWTAGQMI